MKHLIIVLAGFAMTACTAVKVKEVSQPRAAETQAVAVAQPKLPLQNLSPKMLYEFLLGEIAGQRGELNLSATAYWDLAKTSRDPRVAERATQIALYARQEALALEASKLWLALAPESVQARQTVAALLVNQGRLDEAKPHLERILASDAVATARGLLHLNSLFAKDQNKAAALQLVRELSLPYLHLPEAHFAIAQAAAGAGDHQLALAETQEALRLRPEWEAGALLRGQLLQRAHPGDAIKYYQEFLKTHPRAQDVRLTYARYLVNQKNYAEARNQFKQLMTDFPGNADVYVAVGLLSMQLNDYAAAERYFKEALEFGPKDSARVMLYLGQLNEERKNYAQAAQWYGSVPPGESFIQAQIRLAGVTAKTGKLAEARKHLSQLNVSDKDQRVQLIIAEAQLLRDNKAHQLAFDLLTQALQKYPNHVDLLYDRAMAAEKLNKLDVMERDLRQLIKMKPDYAHAYNALGYTFADKTNRFDEAAQLIEKALALSPEDAFIMDSMGWLQYRMGKHETAVDYLKRAYALRPDPEIAAHLGEALWAYGKPEEALGVLQAALEEHPEHEGLRDILKRFNN